MTPRGFLRSRRSKENGRERRFVVKGRDYLKRALGRVGRTKVGSDPPKVSYVVIKRGDIFHITMHRNHEDIEREMRKRGRNPHKENIISTGSFEFETGERGIKITHYPSSFVFRSGVGDEEAEREMEEIIRSELRKMGVGDVEIKQYPIKSPELMKYTHPWGLRREPYYHPGD